MGRTASGSVTRLRLVTVLLVAVCASRMQAQVTSDRLQNAAKEARNWLIYSGGYFSNRYSNLTQITPGNAKNLELKWMYQAAVAGAWQTTPLVVDGVMYLTQRPNDVVALDAKTGVSTGSIVIRSIRRRSSAAAPTIAASRFSATRCSWARSTRISWRSTRRPDAPCGIRRSPRARAATRSRTRRWS